MSVINVVNPALEYILQRLNELASTYEDHLLTSEGTTCYTPDNGTPPRFTLHINRQGQGTMDHPVDAEPTAVGQFLARIKVPVDFWRSCSTDLQNRIINEKNVGKRFLFRCRRVPTGPDTTRLYCRGVVGPMFPISHDDRFLVPTVLAALGSQTYNIARFWKNDQSMELIVRFTDTAAELDGVNVVGGLSIVSSETGHSSIWIEPILDVMNNWYLGNRTTQHNPALTRIIHRGTLPTVAELTGIINQAKTTAQVGVMQYLQASQENVTNIEAIAFLEEIEDLPKRVAEVLQKEWQIQQHIRKTQVMRSVLAACSALPILQQQTIRRSTGRFIRLFDNPGSTLAEFVNHQQ